MSRLFCLDYGAGNVKSLANSLFSLGYSFEWITQPSDFLLADKLIFPGVGAFDTAISYLSRSGLLEPLRDYISSGKPYFGICIGMQVLFASSTESPGVPGLSIIPTPISCFTPTPARPVPHMGWNSVRFVHEEDTQETGMREDKSYYFVHSYRAPYPSDAGSDGWAHTVAQYGPELFLATVRRGNVFATQFHPEKSGPAGLAVLAAWLSSPISALSSSSGPRPTSTTPLAPLAQDGFTKRIIACLDVRSNDAGDLVVTKGDQYAVRDSSSSAVRNLGKPLALTTRYYASGADELCLLNITSFRSSPLADQPMLGMTSAACARVHVPLTIGGGIRDLVEPDGTTRSALEVAGAYFRAGADKVSIGGDAVLAVEALLAREAAGEPGLTGTSGIETIARAYGSQAVVVSIDPLKVYLSTWDTSIHGALPPPEAVVSASSALSPLPSEKGTDKKWSYLCTIHGGRTLRPLTALSLAVQSARLGAGELLVNSIDRDGQKGGYDLDLLLQLKRAVGVPVVASSGAGCAADFVDVFRRTGVESALAAGIFHREEVGIGEVKDALRQAGVPIRLV